jgi:hypothetical protein
MRLTIDQLCSIFHYAMERENLRLAGGDTGFVRVNWESVPEADKDALRAAISALNSVIRKDEREFYRSELMECLDDLRLNRIGS